MKQLFLKRFQRLLAMTLTFIMCISSCLVATPSEIFAAEGDTATYKIIKTTAVNDWGNEYSRSGIQGVSGNDLIESDVLLRAGDTIQITEEYEYFYIHIDNETVELNGGEQYVVPAGEYVVKYLSINSIMINHNESALNDDLHHWYIANPKYSNLSEATVKCDICGKKHDFYGGLVNGKIVTTSGTADLYEVCGEKATGQIYKTGSESPITVGHIVVGDDIIIRRFDTGLLSVVFDDETSNLDYDSESIMHIVKSGKWKLVDRTVALDNNEKYKDWYEFDIDRSRITFKFQHTDDPSNAAYHVVSDNDIPTTCADVTEVEGNCSICGHEMMVKPNKISHTEVIDAEVAPTCTIPGKTQGSHCSVCGAIIKAQTTIPVINHVVSDNDIPTTCADVTEVEGNCSICGHEMMIKPNKISHTEVIDAEVAPTCTIPGKTQGSHCSVCGAIIKAQTTIPAINHKNKETRNKSDATTEKTGYTGDVYCVDCGVKLSEGKVIPKIVNPTKDDDTNDDNTKDDNTKDDDTKVEDTKVEDTKVEDTKVEDTKPSQTDEVITDKTSGAEVVVLNVDKKEVSYVAPVDTKEKEVKIPEQVVVDGVSYKVTKVEDKAFKGNKTITKVTIPKTVTTIGKDAFNGCTKLKTVSIPKNVTQINNNAFKGCTSLKSVSIPNKVTKIGANAFNGCKKLTTITIKSTKLTSKSISKNAFKGLTKKTTIKVPKSKLKAYKKLFKSKGLSKSVKIKGI